MKALAIALIRTLAMGGITIGAVFTLLQAWLIGLPLLLVGVYLERKTASATIGKHSGSTASRPRTCAAIWPHEGCILGWPAGFPGQHLVHGLSDPIDDVDLDRHRDDQWWYDLSAEQDHAAALNSSDWGFYDTQSQRQELESTESTFDDIVLLTHDDI